MHKNATMCRFDLASLNQNGLISRSKAPRIDDRSSDDRKDVCEKKIDPVAFKRVLKKPRAKRVVRKMDMKVQVFENRIVADLPIKTVSEANCFEPWRAKYVRHKDQQRLVSVALSPLRGNFRMPCKIMLTRFAPDALDTFDNLPMSFKYIVDAVCAIITGNYVAGKADSDKRISISCDQIKSVEYGIRVEITW